MSKKPRVWAIRLPGELLTFCVGEEPRVGTDRYETMYGPTIDGVIIKHLCRKEIRRLTGYSLGKLGVAEEVEIIIRPKRNRKGAK